MKHLKRKLDAYLLAWKKNKKHLPLIIKGARQIGKTFSIREFAKTYDNFLEINFVTEKKHKAIFVDGYAVADVVKNISLINPDFKFEKGKTLVCYCLHFPELPLKANYDSSKYKIYFADTGLMVASLDDESSDDLRANKNLGVYKGALYENIVGDMLVKSGNALYYYADEKSHLEMDFFSRTKKSLVPVEVKAKDGATASLRKLIENKSFPDIKRGVKFRRKNVDYNENFYTFPYFTAFLLKRFLAEQTW